MSRSSLRALPIRENDTFSGLHGTTSEQREELLFEAESRLGWLLAHLRWPHVRYRESVSQVETERTSDSLGQSPRVENAVVVG